MISKQWQAVEITGEVHPEPRSGHQAVAVLNDIYVLGGWNSMQQFGNTYIFNIDTKEWTKSETSGELDGTSVLLQSRQCPT